MNHEHFKLSKLMIKIFLSLFSMSLSLELCSRRRGRRHWRSCRLLCVARCESVVSHIVNGVRSKRIIRFFFYFYYDFIYFHFIPQHSA